MAEDMNIKIRRVTGKDAPRPIGAISIPDPAYGGAKLKTVELDLTAEVFDVDEHVAAVIFTDPTLSRAFEVHEKSLAIPRVLANDSEFMEAWNKRRDSKAPEEKKTEEKKSSK